MAEPIRGRVSPYTFLGRFQQQQKQQQVEGADNTLALRQNQVAISNVNSSLVRITEQINVLSVSLQGISNQIKETSSLENLRDQQKQRQEKTLAERQIREGKESLIETKIQSALVTPLQVVGAKAQGTLFSLGRFFNILLGGFLLNRILDSVSELSSNGKLTLKNLGDKIAKDLGIVGGIFLLINGGFTTGLSSIIRLGLLLGRIAVKGLLLAPINLAFNIAKGALSALSSGIRNLPRIPAGSGAGAGGGGGRNQGGGTNQGSGRNQGGGRPSGGGFPIGASSILSLINFFGFNQSIGQSVSGPVAGGLLSMLVPPQLRMAMFLTGSFIGPQAYETYREKIESTLPALGMNRDQFIDMVTGRTRDLTPPNRGGNVTVIDAGGGNGATPSQTNVPSSTPSTTSIPLLPSSNTDNNFFLLYSKLQYNVVG